VQRAVHFDHERRITARRLVKTVDILGNERTEISASFERDKSTMCLIRCCVKRR
jgi:hypothetical protein